MACRQGSASAAKTPSATASGSPPGIEVFDEFVQLAPPPLDVATVGTGVEVVGYLGEAGLDDSEPGSAAHRIEGEFDLGTARIVGRQAGDAPGVTKDMRRFEALDRSSTVSFSPNVSWARPPRRRSTVAF